MLAGYVSELHLLQEQSEQQWLTWVEKSRTAGESWPPTDQKGPCNELRVWVKTKDLSRTEFLCEREGVGSCNCSCGRNGHGVFGDFAAMIVLVRLRTETRVNDCPCAFAMTQNLSEFLILRWNFSGNLARAFDGVFAALQSTNAGDCNVIL